MKEYFYEKDNKVYIMDDKQGLIVEDSKNNTEEILITQNNIEELECEINDSKENKERILESKKGDIPKAVILTVLCLFGLVIALGTGIEKLPIIIIIASSLFAAFPIIYINDIIKYKRYIEMYDTYIKELEIELEKENEKLNFLNKVAKNKTVDYTAIKEISKSEIIENLNYKKVLIKDYIKNRKKYISSFKDGSLNNLLKSNNYDVCDINFINYLIEEELKNENTNSNKKAKQKRK